MGIHTAIDINAPADAVWRTLMDFQGAQRSSVHAAVSLPAARAAR